MNTTNPPKNSHPSSGRARACAVPVRRQRFDTEENGCVEYCEFFLRFTMLTCLLCTLSICLVHIVTPASVSTGETSTAASTPEPTRKTAPAVTVRITLPDGFHL